jgi:cell division protein FtsA
MPAVSGAPDSAGGAMRPAAALAPRSQAGDGMTKNDRYMVGLDIGTSNVNCIIAESPRVGPAGDRRNRLRSVARAAQGRGGEPRVVRGGDQARGRGGRAHGRRPPPSARTSASRGAHIRSVNGRGVVAIAGRDRTVSREDVTRVLEAAKAISIPQDQEILHVVPAGVRRGRPGRQSIIPWGCPDRGSRRSCTS